MGIRLLCKFNHAYVLSHRRWCLDRLPLHLHVTTNLYHWRITSGGPGQEALPCANKRIGQSSFCKPRAAQLVHLIFIEGQSELLGSSPWQPDPSTEPQLDLSRGGFDTGWRCAIESAHPAAHPY